MVNPRPDVALAESASGAIDAVAPAAVTAPDPVPDTAGVADPRRWAVFGVVAVALLMVSIDQTAVATALPAIQTDLATSLAWSSWTITVFALGNILAMPVSGRLADQFGRRTVFLAAILIFTIGSLAAGLSGNIAVLILARLVQGIAGGAVMPAATGLIADHFGPGRDRAIGMFSSIFPVGAIVGPVVGGVLVALTGWRSIFLVNLPIGVLLLVTVPFVVRYNRGIPGGRIDGAGVGLLCTTLLSAMVAVTVFAGPGPIALRLSVAGAGVVLAAVFGRLLLRHARVPGAVVPLRLLRGRGFGMMNTINVMFGAAAVGFGALVPLYAHERYGILPLAAGSLLAMRAVGMIATSSTAVMLLRRTGHRWLMIVGFVLMAAGMLLLAAPPQGMGPQLWLMIGAGVTGLGMGIAAPASNNAALHLAPDEIASVTGLRGMFRQVGAIASVSVTTAVVSASVHPGATQAWTFVVFAALLLAALPLIRSMPDHRGSW